MTSILTNPSAVEMAAAVEENLHTFFRAMQALPGTELVEMDTHSYHHALPTSPFFKGVWRCQLPPDEVDTIIEETLAWFKARQAPFAFWWVSSLTQPSNLAEKLQAHGLTPNFMNDPGMIAKLDELKPMPATPGGFKIVRVLDHHTLADWGKAFCGAYELPEALGQAWVDAAASVGFENAPWQYYLGYLDGEPVATNILFKGGGVAGLYAVGTIPSARNQGIGGAITLQPLLDAREQGYQYAVLYASELGFPVYQRLGFRDANYRIGRYLWVNS